jgi:hypothetical protein
MSRIESRITLINRFCNKGEGKQGLIPHLISVNKVIDRIDSDEEVQIVCECFELKKRRIAQLNGLSRIEFHQKINEVITDTEGTNFLIFKN